MIPPLLLAAVAFAVPLSWPGGGHAANPTWSPDGAWLAFEVNNNADQADLWVVALAGGTPGVPRKLGLAGSGGSSFSSSSRFAANPVWIPASPAFLFEGSTTTGAVRLYFATAAGSAPAAEYLPPTRAPGNLAWPALSPDGRTLAFTSSASGAGDIHLYSVTTGEVTKAFNSELPENAPQFSPDGRTLVFSRKMSGTEDLATWSVGTTVIQPLLAGNNDQTRPRYAGGKVVYFSNERGADHWDIVVADAVPGGARVVVARDIRLPTRSPPQLTPDGRAVVWVPQDAAQDHEVRVTRLDGSATVPLDTGFVAVADPTLVTAGGRTWLAFTALPEVGSTWRQLHVLDVSGRL